MSTIHTCANNAPINPSRRNFFGFGTMAALTAGLCLAGGTDVFAQSETQTQERPARAQRAAENAARQLPAEFALRRSLFTPHLNEYFHLRLNGEEIHLQLFEISDLKHTSLTPTARRRGETTALKAKAREESFTLLFRSLSETVLPQHTWKLEHETMNTVELFLVPVGRPDGVWHFYEAVFNRLQQ